MGIKNHGRGFKYSKKKDNLDMFTSEFSDVPFSNYLNSNWYKKNHYNSWCKVKCELSSKQIAKEAKTKLNNKTISTINICYGQLNYFFTLNLSQDEFVSSLHIASVTCRETHFPDFTKNYDDLSGSELYNQSLPLPHIALRKKIEEVSEPITSLESEVVKLPLFISFENILKTKVASIGFLKRGIDDFIPILVKTEKILKPFLFTYKISENLSNQNKNPYVVKLIDEHLFPIEMLAFIDLSPENLIEEEKQKIFDEINWIDDIDGDWS
jgi:hypothetical protein